MILEWDHRDLGPRSPRERDYEACSVLSGSVARDLYRAHGLANLVTDLALSPDFRNEHMSLET